ncbi:hypothetical protein ACOSP7_019219 [Xanthoceras sorbifolium]
MKTKFKAFKHRYHPNCTFLEAKLPSSPSIIWRSFLWGRELIEQGSKWRIGGGATVQVYEDRWIPIPSSFKVFSNKSLEGDAMVSGLNTTSGDWNSQHIRYKLSAVEADAILNLPSAPANYPNVLCWHENNLCQYYVKHGYKIASDLQAYPSPSNFEVMTSRWKFLWSL